MAAVAAVPIAYWLAASTALSVASTVSSMQSQKAEAEANASIQENNNREITRAALEQYGELSAAEDSIQEAAGQESLEQQKLYYKSKGRVDVLAGSSGTYGGSVDAMLLDLNQTRGQNLSTITKNRRTQLNEITLQATQIRNSARASKGTRVFNKPSGLQMGLSVGSNLASGAIAYSSAKAEAAKISGGG
jgi:hypothetical protein